MKQYGGGEKTHKSSGLQWRQRLRHTHGGTCRSADKWSSVQSETRMLTVTARHEAMPCAWNQSTLQTFHWSCSCAVRRSAAESKSGRRRAGDVNAFPSESEHSPPPPLPAEKTETPRGFLTVLLTPANSEPQQRVEGS